MYKRPRRVAQPTTSIPVSGIQAPSPGLGWKKWNPPLIVDESLSEPAGELDGGVDEASAADLEAIENERKAQELEALREAARQEGYAQGLSAGLEEGKQQGFAAGYEEGLAKAEVLSQELVGKRVAVLDALVAQTHDEFSRLQEELGQSLVHLGVRVAEHVLGHALEDPAPSALAILKEVLRHNDEDEQVLTAWLNPEDLELIEEDIKAIPVLCTLRLLKDASLARGGIRVKTPHGDIDATLQTRWKAALASFGYTSDDEEHDEPGI